MNVDFLRLQNFRNLKDISFEPGKKVNIIYGDNAQGKTNLLEAIWLLSGAKSFRPAKDQEYLLFGASGAQIEAEFWAEQRKQSAKIVFDQKKTAYLNEIKQSSVTGFAGVFTAVVFSPAHLNLVKEGPAFRRRFIDTSICQITPRYIDLIARYQRVLFQRNMLLKDISYTPALLDTLDVWDQKLCALAAQILSMRLRYTEKLKEKAAEIYAGISKGETLSIFYRCSVQEVSAETEKKEAEQKMRGLLLQMRAEDLRSRTTGVGPHRDDLEIFIDEKNIRSFGSQGQQRSAVLALKLAESLCMGEMLGENPVILLDDVMSELDHSRRDYLLNHLDQNQVFVTCCDKNYFSSLQDGKVFLMKQGELFLE